MLFIRHASAHSSPSVITALLTLSIACALAAPFSAGADEPAVITGEVLHHESGDGVPDVFVGLTDSAGESTIAIDWTGPDGEFMFANVPPGEYQLVLPEALLRDSPEADIPYEALNGARALTLDAGAEEHIVFEVRPWSPIHGVVLDDEGDPAADAEVVWGAPGVSAERASADDRGRFTLYPPAKTSRIHVTAFTGAAATTAAGPFDTNEPEPIEIELRLTEPRTAAISGKAETPEGEPLADRRVFLYRIEEDWHYRAAFTDTDDKGAYQFADLTPGEYRVSLRGIPAHHTDDEERTGAPVLLTADQHAGDFVITPDTAIATALDPVIAGTVRAADGEPAYGVTVVATGPAGVRRTLSGPGGAFALRNLTPGEYRLYFTHADYQDLELHDIPAGTEDLDIELPEFATIGGMVVDAETGEPVTEFAIAHWRTPPPQAYHRLYAEPLGTHPGGEFHIEGVRRGEAHVMVRAPGYHLKRTLIADIEPGETRDGAVVSLTPGPGAEGKTVDDQGEPVGNALIAFEPFDGFPASPALGHTQSDSSGAFTLDALPEEPFTLYAMHPDYAVGKTPVDPAAREPLTVEIPLPRRAAIDAQVTIAGEIIEQIGAYWNPPRDERIAELRAERGLPAPEEPGHNFVIIPGGRLELTDLDPGEGYLSLWIPTDHEGSWWGWRKTFELAPGGVYDEDIPVAANRGALVLELSELNNVDDVIEVMVYSEAGEITELANWVKATAPTIRVEPVPAGEISVSVSEAGGDELDGIATDLAPGGELKLRFDGVSLQEANNGAS